MMGEAAHDNPSGRGPLPRIVVVGTCASGKTSLARELARLGIPVRVCGQEHSAIRDLWRKLEPDILVALEIDLPTLRARRHEMWPEPLYAVQRHRLASAVSAADLVIDTRVVTPVEAAIVVRRFLADHCGWAASPEAPS